jgi:LEA14-like dessication related protein
MSDRVIHRRFVAALLITVCVACVSTAPRVEPPKLTSITVRLDRLERAQAFFAIGVELANPNATDIEVTGFDATLSIENEPVATAVLALPARIPPGATAAVELNASTGVEALLRIAAAAIRRGAASPPDRAPSLRYSIDGAALINGTLRVPFARSGELGHPMP